MRGGVRTLVGLACVAVHVFCFFFFFFSSRRRHTRSFGDWSSDVCSSDLGETGIHLEWKQRTPLCSREATGISWSSLGGLKGVKPPEAFGERSREDRKSTRLNSSHQKISYAVFCLKKKKKKEKRK